MTAGDLRPEGSRVPLPMGEDRPASTMNLDFKSKSSSCGTGHSPVSGIGRALLDVARPSRSAGQDDARRRG